MTRHYLDVVDVLEAGAELPPDVLALPMVVRAAPLPERRVIGDLSQAVKAAEWLGLTAVELDAKP